MDAQDLNCLRAPTRLFNGSRKVAGFEALQNDLTKEVAGISLRREWKITSEPLQRVRASPNALAGTLSVTRSYSGQESGRRRGYDEGTHASREYQHHDGQVRSGSW